eukprot:g2686.t1
MKQSKKRSGFASGGSNKKARKSWSHDSSSKNGGSWGRGKGEKKKYVPLPTKKERRLARAHGAVVEEVKSMWNRARDKSTPRKEKSKVVESIMKKLEGALSDIATRHDSARVIQFCVQFGSEGHRTSIVEALKGRIVELCKVTHGRFVVQKLFDYCKARALRRKLLSALERHVVNLSMHATGALVVEHLYLKALSQKEQRWLFQEFYGAEFKHFKREKRSSLACVLEDEPKKREDILRHLTNVVSKQAEKGLLSMSFVHDLLASLLENASDASMTAKLVLPYVKEVAPTLCSTRKGVVALVQCIAYASAKDRKRIVKCFKDDLFKESEPGLAQHPFAHLAIIKLLDVVDDTKLLVKHIVKSILARLSTACFDPYARKMLLHILSPRNSKYFAPSDVLLIERRFVVVDGERKSTSKKDANVRELELAKACREGLVEYCASEANAMLNDPLARDVLVETIARWTEADLVGAVAGAAICAGEGEDDADMPVCHQYGHKTLQRIIAREDAADFAVQLFRVMDGVDGGASHWATASNRSAFVLLALLKHPKTLPLVRKSLANFRVQDGVKMTPGLTALLGVLKGNGR